jgi:PAS domain S-box-containing protein
LHKALLCYWFGKREASVDYVTEAANYLAGSTAQATESLFYFYDSLVRLTQYTTVSASDQSSILIKVAANQQKMEHWANHAPMNFQHKYDLVSAEQSHYLGEIPAAIDLYDRAISGAHANGYIQEEAMANELAARFYLDWGKEKIAAVYMQEAYYCYSHWGGKAKVADLESRYPELLHPILQPKKTSVDILETLANTAMSTVSVSDTRIKSGNTGLNQMFDVVSILQASQTLSSTIELDELLHQLTQIILQNSGGDYCALILPDETLEWQVKAIATPDETQLYTETLTNNANLPVKLIQYVKNTQKVIVIDGLETDLPVIDDYLKRHKPKSLLCLPIFNQGNPIGLLYLHNRLTNGVFTSDRILVLNFLCTQAAIALENARLYQSSQRALQTIQQQEAQYRSIFEAVSNGLAIVSLETTQVVAANPAYCQMHGYTYEEVLHLRPAQILRSPAYDKFESFLESIQQGQAFVCDAVCTRKDGTLFNTEIHSVPFLYKTELCGLTVFRDVTQQRQLASALKQKNQVLKQTLIDLQQAQLQVVHSEKMSALGNLVAGVAHEINNPMSCIIGNVDATQNYFNDLLGLLDLYAKQVPDPDPDLKAELEIVDLDYVRDDLPNLMGAMQNSGERIINISKSLRTFSRADTETRQDFNVHEGLESTVLILQHRLKANEQRPAIKIVKEYGDIPDIACFPGQLNQVFMNILANAIDALDEASQALSDADLAAHPQRITIQTELGQQQVMITIVDNGPGIPEAIKSKIFDYLFTTKDVGKGTGLGLAIAHQIIVDTHGGRLAVQSDVGQGTEFCICLPL